MSNIFVRIPKLGDYVCKRVSDRKVFYLDWTNPDCPEGNLFTVGEEQYEKIGSAVPYEGDKVLCLWRETAIKTWCERIHYKLSGYTLDGTDRTGTLSIREASNSWASNVDYVIPYNATTMEQFVEQLNAYFASTEAFDGEHQDWFAEVVGEEGETYVRIGINYIIVYQLSYNTSRDGFATETISQSGESIPARSRLKNGYEGAVEAIGVGVNFSVHSTYLREANSIITSDITSIAISSLPLCDYLGMSSDNNDHCAFLRSVYGDGEEGWLRFLESCFPILDGTYGIFGPSGKELSKRLSHKTYNSLKKTNEPLFKGSLYCANIESDTVNKDDFWLTSAREFVFVMRDVRYGNYGNITDDPLNASRYKQGWAQIKNSQNNCWTANVFGSMSTACYLGRFGSFNFGQASYFANTCLPVTLFTL